jgi:hypothetical protein
MKGPRPSVHGRAVSAPPELFEFSDSPTPAGVVTNKKRPNRSVKERKVDQEPGFVAKLATGIRLLAGLAIVVGASTAVAWSVHRYAMTTPRQIRTVALTGNSRIAEGDVIEQAASNGENLFSSIRTPPGKAVQNPDQPPR